MRNSTGAVVLLCGAMLGCSNDVATNSRPPAAGNSATRIAVAQTPPTTLRVGTGAAKDKKKPASKDRKKHLPAGWHADYAQALAQARSAGSPLLVLFH
jgi:hypothetical protein